MKMLMDVFSDSPHVVYGVAAGTVLATSFLAHKLLFRKRRSSLQDLMKGPPDTVILFQYQRGPYAPSLSPFPIKMETYMRMAKIPYWNNTMGIMSSRDKMGWIAYNGEAVSDWQFCIEYLNAKRGINPNKHLTHDQLAVAKSFKILVEEHLYLCVAYFRWIHDKEQKVVNELLQFPRFLKRLFINRVKDQLWAQGIGRHTAEEIERIMLTDLQALSDYLGKKTFFMGEIPCEVDCSIFALLSQFVWQQKDEVLGNVIQAKFANLHCHCLRMKERFWPDWDQQSDSKGDKENINLTDLNRITK